MQININVIECYNKTAKNYAAKFIDELTKKHLDRLLLQSFAIENRDSGKLVDLGCGPGQTTKFLWECGITNLLGVDISPVMIEEAAKLHPQIAFETADILQLPYADQSFGGAIAFYSIVHFNYEQVKMAFREVKRILKAAGQFLFSFHIGNEMLHVDTLLDHPVNIDFYFFQTQKIIDLLIATGFEIIDAVERLPYPNVEYPSKRAYIWAQINNSF